MAGILAIEVLPEGGPATLTLPLESAAALVDVLSEDLLRVLPGVDQCGLAIAAALYDQAQMLRPGFPVHAALAELYGQEPRARQQPSLMAFGSSAGHMAKAELEPDPRLIGSPMLLLPFVLMVPAGIQARLAEHMESSWEEQGLAAAKLALFLNQAFSIQTEHVRFMTQSDLCAICSVQYQQAGLESLWLLIECALLSPHRQESVVSAEGLGWRFADGRISHDAEATGAQKQEMRQYTAILGAHGLIVTGNRLTA
ncbi:MAG: hypothetical protein IPK97_04180 [Ahniella sp.]|nr:hypothetical protein [Ahniella sp.]